MEKRELVIGEESRVGLRLIAVVAGLEEFIAQRRKGTKGGKIIGEHQCPSTALRPFCGFLCFLWLKAFVFSL